MSDLLSIGAAGVNAYRDALAVVGDNVANADTSGYVRRGLVIRSSPGGSGDALSRGLVSGSGSVAGAAIRVDDAFKTAAARNAGSDVARLSTRADWLTRLQGTLGSGATGLTSSISGFFDAASTLAATPASLATRTVFLDAADQTAAQFRSTASGLNALTADLHTAGAAAATTVNGITTTLADVNTQLRRTSAGGAASNALLDQRDQLIGALAQQLRITTTTAANGTVAVRLGDGDNGPLLVDGSTATRIGIQPGATGDQLVLSPTHEPLVVRLPASGGLAGLVEASQQVAAAIVAVDALATRFANAVNAQQTAGVDASSTDGTPLFATRGLLVSAGGANGGSATLDTGIADGAAVSALGYTMRFDGSVWSLARGDGSGTVTGPGALGLDGVTLTPSSGARAGDSFTLSAVDGAGGLQLRPLTPSQVAVADRWLSDAGDANIGTVALAVTTDPAAAGLPVLPAYRIDITGAATANIVDPATNAVLAAVPINGISIAGAGFDFRMSGGGIAGDSFRILRNNGGGGSNGNIVALGKLRAQAGAGGTIEGSLDATVTGIAGTLAGTKSLLSGATAVASDATRAADAVSGVDLDQEAARLQQLQTAYKACSQVIATARELFDTLLTAVH